MDIKEFLKSELKINLNEVATRMWPNNQNAKVLMSMKLKGTRQWTDDDTERAKTVLRELYTEGLSKLDNL